MKPRAILLSFSCASLFAATSFGGAPVVETITPRGVQRGAEQTFIFKGARLKDAQEVLLYKTGVTVTKIEAVSNEQLKVTMKVDPNCTIGEQPLRLRTESGITDLRTFFVDSMPTVDEVEPNNEFDAPQAIKMGATIAGKVGNDDIDYYKISLKKGQKITAEIDGLRLGDVFFDPYIAILDSDRFELAVSDDTALATQDAFVSMIAPSDGDYVIEVRDIQYAGAERAFYRLHVGAFPRPTAVFPAGGKAGEEVNLRFLGDISGEWTQKIKLPATPTDKFFVFAEKDGMVSPTANPMRVVSFGSVQEKEPNNDMKSATVVGASPIGIDGIIEKPGDVDYYRFKASKGQIIDLRVYARKLRSPLDSFLYVHTADGRNIASNDDSEFPDSFIRFTVPGDGDFGVSIVDQLQRGGPDFVYRIELTPVTPALTVGLPPFTDRTQERLTIPVPKGNRYATLFSAKRTDFGGGLVFDAKDLPAGVKMIAEPMADNLSLTPVVFEATGDAGLSGKLSQILARHADPNQKVIGSYEQMVPLVFHNVGGAQRSFLDSRVDRLSVAVTKEAPVKIDLVEPKAPLVQNGSMELKVVATRKEGFKDPITLSFPFTPPGIGTIPSVTIPEGKNEAVYPINASSGAQVREWKIVVIGQVNVDGGPVVISTQLAKLEVAEPYVGATMAMTAVEQGKPAEMVCKIDVKKPFEGKAKIQLVGLPALATADPMEIDKDTKEVVFKVKSDLKTPPGQHKSVFAQLVLTEKGEPVPHNMANGSILRVDPPAKPKATVAQAPAKKDDAKPAETKRLSRLEQLRLDQAKKTGDKSS